MRSESTIVNYARKLAALNFKMDAPKTEGTVARQNQGRKFQLAYEVSQGVRPPCYCTPPSVNNRYDTQRILSGKKCMWCEGGNLEDAN